MSIINVEFKEPVLPSTSRTLQVGQDGVTKIEVDGDFLLLERKGKTYLISVPGMVRYIHVSTGPVVQGSDSRGPNQPEPLMKVADDPAEDAKIDLDKRA